MPLYSPLGGVSPATGAQRARSIPPSGGLVLAVVEPGETYGQSDDPRPIGVADEAGTQSTKEAEAEGDTVEAETHPDLFRGDVAEGHPLRSEFDHLGDVVRTGLDPSLA